MRPISMENVETKRSEILDILQDVTTTHEQKVTFLARAAENFLTVLDEPAEMDELMRCDEPDRCICNLFEGEAPYRPATSARTTRSSCSRAVSSCSWTLPRICSRP